MGNLGFNPSKFVKGSPDYQECSISTDPTTVVPAEEPAKKKRGRPKGSTNSNKPAPVNPNTLVAESSMSYLQSNIPYANAYTGTNEQLDQCIDELNMLGRVALEDLNNIRNSKTLKNKYNYINDAVSNVTNIINNKVNIIKEKNKTINDVNNLEIKRFKDMKSTIDEKDDDAKMAQLYNSFINTPIGVGVGGPNVLGPSIQDMTLINSNNNPDLSRMDIGSDAQQMAWEQGLDPSQRRMLLDAKGQIETVVMFDESSGNRWYEVIDKNTRQPVPEVEKPDNSTVYELDINQRGGFAKDTNRGVTYPLIVLNGNPEMSEY